MNDIQAPVMYTANEVVAPMYKNQPVATLAVLADYLWTSKDTLKSNLKKNPNKFIEGKHYFNISHENLKGANSPLGQAFDYKGNTGIQVWTERGCARLSKLLRTDAAWELWELMEESYFNKQQLPKLPQTYAQALRQLADTTEEKEKALLERDIAIKTKAQIGSRREATAMNKLSQKSKEIKKLEIELDKSKDFSPAVTMTQNNPEHDFEGKSDNAIGRAMSKFCRDNGYFFKKVNVDYTSFRVGTYPKEAWLARFGVSR